MKAVSTVYPALGRFFLTETEMANAACMSRSHCHRCLNGLDGKDFTPQQKRALTADILARMHLGQIPSDEIGMVTLAYESRSNFDLVFKNN